MLTVFGVKGAAGATTVALLAAALWPSRAVLVEADPAGGDLALRLAGPGGQVLPRTPNIAGLGVEASAAMTPERIWAHAVQTAVAASVICGIPEAEPMRKTVVQHGRAIAEALAGTDAVLDAGRLAPDTVALAFAAHADSIAVVVGDHAEQFFHVRDLLGGLVGNIGSPGTVRPSICAVVVADQRRGNAAVAELSTALRLHGLPVTVAGWVGLDRKGLRQWLARDRSAARSILIRSAKPVVTVLAGAHDDVRTRRAAASTLTGAEAADVR